MGMNILYALGAVSVLFGIVPILMSLRFKRYVDARLRQPLGKYTPPVTVIVPCKGIDLEFRHNIRSVLEQDYPDYEVVFVTATDDDPAYGELRAIIADCPRARASLVVAGVKPGRAQKLTNLMCGHEHAAASCEVFVHLDSDIQIGKRFLRHLVAPLERESVGATSGFPWYVPRTGRPGSILRSLWGGGALPLLVDPKRNFAWGGANAVRKVTYEQAGVQEAMNGGVSDTFAITNGARKQGALVEFVPQCLCLSPDDSGFTDTVEWSNRQTIISRVYSPAFWWTVACTYSVANALLLVGVGIFCAGLLSNHSALIPPSLLILSLIPMGMLNAAILLRVVKRMLPENAAELQRLRWRYYLLTPVASLLIMINSAVSLTTNEIEWRGIRYRLVSPDRTEVLDRDR